MGTLAAAVPETVVCGTWLLPPPPPHEARTIQDNSTADERHMTVLLPLSGSDPIMDNVKSQSSRCETAETGTAISCAGWIDSLGSPAFVGRLCSSAAPLHTSASA